MENKIKKNKHYGTMVMSCLHHPGDNCNAFLLFLVDKEGIHFFICFQEHLDLLL